MKTFKFAILGLALGSAVSLAEDCQVPEKPEMPDGASATMEQMLQGQQAVKTFQASLMDYLKCLEPQLTAAQAAAEEGTEGAADNYKQLEETYNTGVSMEEEVAGQFNTEIREYKAANPG
ncbi:MAG: hypothetical protein OEV47_16200 [Gammaproteobacteria bacterium]|jgi:uncharacterized protein involved in exopolysaccharide biosynthesis|nr:hypothetical protein [Gammaproteobacteria bacterium]